MAKIHHEGWTDEEWEETMEILNKMLDKKDKK